MAWDSGFGHGLILEMTTVCAKEADLVAQRDFD